MLDLCQDDDRLAAPQYCVEAEGFVKHDLGSFALLILAAISWSSLRSILNNDPRCLNFLVKAMYPRSFSTPN
jgi:hypothetical protein